MDQCESPGGKAQISMTCSLFIGGYSLPSLEQVCYLHGPRVKEQKDIGRAGEKSKWNCNIPDSLTEEIEIFPLGNRKGLGGGTLHLSSLFVSVFLSQVGEDAVIYSIPRKRCLSVYVCINRQTNEIWHWIFNSNTDLISWFLRHCC